MHTRSRVSVVAAALFLASLPLAAAPALAVVVGSADVTAGSELSSPADVEVQTGADLDWRVPFSRTAYFALWGSARVSAYPLSGLAIADRESLGIELGATPAGVSLTAASSAQVSTGFFDSAREIEPEWEFSAEVPIGEYRYLGTSYRGNYRFSDADSDDRLENRLSVLILSDPAFTVSLAAALTGGCDFFPETLLEGTGGLPTETRRRDLLVTGSLSADLLARYFTRWEGSLSAGYRASNATRYLAQTDFLEQRSEDRVFASATGRLSRSVSSALSVTVEAGSDAALYLDRAAIDAGGVPLDENLAYLRGTLGVEVAWSPGGNVYFIGTASGAGSAANDSLYSGWSATGGLSVEWRL